MSVRTKLLLFLCMMLWTIRPALAQSGPTGSLVDVMTQTPNLGLFTEMIQFLGLDQSLTILENPDSTEGGLDDVDVFYTVFALDDNGVKALLNDLGYSDVHDVSETDRRTLTLVLMYHILPGKYPSISFEAIEQASGKPVQLMTALHGATLTYNRGIVDSFASIAQADIEAVNGYVHVLDTFLIPTSNAFERSVKSLASNTDLKRDQDEEDTIADILRDDDNLSMVSAALIQANLMDDLDEKGPYTIFVMENDALTRDLQSANATFDALLADPETLSRLLVYHILPGEYSFDDLSIDGGFVGTMLEPTVVQLGFSGDRLKINTVPVMSSDRVASNGIIHVIDGVLLPPAGD